MTNDDKIKRSKCIKVTGELVESVFKCGANKIKSNLPDDAEFVRQFTQDGEHRFVFCSNEWELVPEGEVIPLFDYSCITVSRIGLNKIDNFRIKYGRGKDNFCFELNNVTFKLSIGDVYINDKNKYYKEITVVDWDDGLSFEVIFKQNKCYIKTISTDEENIGDLKTFNKILETLKKAEIVEFHYR